MFRAVAMIAVLLSAPPVHAQAEAPSPQSLYEAAVKAYNLGRFEQAIALFSDAYERDPAPVLLFNIAQAHKKLGHHERAIFFYRRYIESETKPFDRADVQGRIKSEEQALAAEQARAAQQVEEKPEAPNAKPQAAPVNVQTRVAPSKGAVDEQDSSPRLRTIGLWTAGGAAVALATGAGLSVWTRSLAQANSERSVFSPQEDRLGRRVETAQWVAYGLGAAAAATSVTLLLLAHSAPRTHVAFSPSPGGCSIGLQGRF